MQAQLAAQARTIGVPRRTLKHRRVHRPHLRTVAVAAVEPDVQEPQQAVAAAEPQQEGAAGGAAEPQQQQQRQQRGNQRRGFNQRPKKVLGPARTIQTADVETGKWYDGTVVSVMEFGAFVNIGAATDGLLHISQISAGFVKRVADVVKVGDEVKVRVVNVDQERGKFAVSMIDPDQKPEEGEQQQQQQRRQQGGGSATEGEPRERFTIKQARREKTPRRARKSPVNKGDTLTAKVVSVSSFGAFVDVGEGMTGLLHETEVVLPEGATAWQEVVKEGQEVTVHVVGVQGEKIQLSMRSKEESEAHSALMADGAQSAAPEGAGTLGHALAAAGISAKLFKARNGSAPPASVPDAAEEAPAAPAAAVEEKVEEPAAHAVAEEEKAEQPAVPAVAEEKAEEPAAPAVAEVETAEEPAVPAVEEEKAEEAAVPAAAAAAPAAPAASAAPAKEEKPAAKAAGGISAALVKQLRETSGAGMMDCKKALAECNGDLDKAKEYLRKKGLASADKKAGRVAAEGMVWSYIHAGSRLGVLVEVNCETDFVARGDKFQELVNDMAMQIAACPEVTVVSVEEVPAEVLERERAIEMEKEDILSKPEAIRPKIVQGRVDKIAKTMALLEQPFVKDSGKTVAEVVKEAVAAIGENIQIRRFAKYTLGEGIEKATADLAADVEAQTKAMQAEAEKKKEKKEEDAPKAEPAAPAKPAVAVSAAVVKQLREKTGAGMMDCKKALGECEGDVDKATEYLRKKGLASADKKSGRVAAEGAIGAYIHSGSRLGVLVEVNCETDFVARGEKFRELVNDMAMQIAACADVRFVSAADVPAEVLERERAIEMEKEDLKSKPEAIRAKIVQGRVDKIAKEMALLEQAFVRDTSKTVAEHIKEQIAAIGENIQVRRFERFVLGEGIEKKVADFAAEVAAQTGAQL